MWAARKCERYSSRRVGERWHCSKLSGASAGFRHARTARVQSRKNISVSIKRMMPRRLVFVHGGLHTGGCWTDTVDAIGRIRPDTESLVVDLPGRRSVGGDLAALTIEDCVRAVKQQILDHNSWRDGPIVLVGHSLAGVILSRVVHQLGTRRAPHVIFVACCVPAKGECVVDTLPFGFKHAVRHLIGRSPVIKALPKALVRYGFGNSATCEQRAKIKAHLVPESSALVTEAVIAPYPDAVRKSWVLTARDRALPVAKQRAFIRNLGGVDDLVCLEAGHEVMFTHPSELASVLVRLTDACWTA